MNLITASVKLAMLRELSFDNYAFPRWQSVAGIMLVAVLSGLGQNPEAAAQAHITLPPQWFTVTMGLLITWALILPAVAVLGWWMKRDERWDGKGDMFNLLASSWFLINLVSAVANLVGAPAFIGTALLLYSLWVTGNALSSAIPKSTLSYSISGLIIGILPGIVISAFFSIAGGILLYKMGYLPPPLPPAPPPPAG